MGDKESPLVKQNLSNILFSSRSHFFLIAVGIFLRLVQYFQNHSLWPDEAWVAVDVVGRSFGEIFLNKSIISQSIPPLGFLLAEKIAITFLGNSEYALRFFPLTASILSLFLIRLLLKKWFSPECTTIVLALFSLTYPLVYYSAEVKQYAFDLIVVIFLYLEYERLKEREFDENSCRRFGILGALSLWVSYGSIFVFLSIGIVSLIENISKRNGMAVSYILKSFLYWSVSFILLAKISLISMVTDAELTGMFQNSLRPRSFIPMEFFMWLKKVLLNMFVNPGGLSMPSLWICVFAMGCAALYQRNKRIWLLLIFPFLGALFAAIFRVYPFKGRLILFLTVCLFIMIAEGLLSVSKLFKKYGRAILTILLGILLFYPVKVAVKNMTDREFVTQDREAMEYFKRHYRKGDFIYINSSAQYAYWYYVGQMNMDKVYGRQGGGMTQELSEEKKGFSVGKIFDQLGLYNGIRYAGIQYQTHLYDDKGNFQDSLYSKNPNDIQLIYPHSSAKIIGQERVWLFLSYIKPEVKRFVLECFQTKGRMLDKLELKGSSIYLFEMSE